MSVSVLIFVGILQCASLALDNVSCSSIEYRAGWTRIYSTNTLERTIREIRRRTNVVVFPDDILVVRFPGTQLIEEAEDWELKRRVSM
jgi:transposase-like protein